uniref:Uncharacterized protein n=1 Tax=Escherichia coli TaxID=562 RepID=A0A8F1IET7_ECOLX|nr:hypothetical protein IHCLGBEB_00039 [Escherichia coli]
MRLADKSTKYRISHSDGKYSQPESRIIPAPRNWYQMPDITALWALINIPLASISRPSGRAFFNSREYSGVKPARSHPHHGLPLSFDGTVYFLMAKEIKGFTPEY